MGRESERYKLFTRRAALLAGGELVLLSALVGRMYYLQVLSRDQYRLLADENRIDLQLLSPPRGRILDRFGAVLAGNRRNYRVLLIAEQTPSVEETLAELGRLIPISGQEHRRVMRELSRKRDFVPITVRENLSWEQFAKVNLHSPDLPGVQTDIGASRYYPFASAAAHVAGYVGEVAADERTGDPLLELPGFHVGKSGIERTYDQKLRGRAGNSRVEVNAFGRIIRELQREDGEPGEKVALTIDGELQRYASGRLRDHSGAAVVLDIESGDVLALASAPSYDTNAFSHGIDLDDWRALLENPRKPLVNKAIAGQYPPGSTFKTVVAVAALEAGVVTPDHRNFCGGSISLGRSIFHCWKQGGHGWKNMTEAIEESCDVYFYDLAQRLGIDRIAEMARRFGLGQRLGIELPGEQPGLVPGRDWKLALEGIPWQKGETVISGIGQGYLLATPLQLAVMVARLANGGYAVKPSLLLEAGVRAGKAPEPLSAEASAAQSAPKPPSLGVSSASLGVVLEGMRRVSNSPRGTAYRARIERPDFALAGKTGTSQVRRISRAEHLGGRLKNEERPWIERDHAMFIAFAPVGAPRYAIAVVVEHGGSGARVAAPIARDILLEAQRLEKAGRVPLRRLAQSRTAPNRG